MQLKMMNTISPDQWHCWWSCLPTFTLSSSTQYHSCPAPQHKLQQPPTIRKWIWVQVNASTAGFQNSLPCYQELQPMTTTTINPEQWHCWQTCQPLPCHPPNNLPCPSPPVTMLTWMHSKATSIATYLITNAIYQIKAYDRTITNPIALITHDPQMQANQLQLTWQCTTSQKGPKFPAPAHNQYCTGYCPLAWECDVHAVLQQAPICDLFPLFLCY